MKDWSSIASINTSLKNNRDQLRQRREPFNKDRLEGKEEYPYNKPLRFKRISKIKLEKFKRQLRQRREEQNRKLLFALSVAVIIVGGIILLVINSVDF